VTGSVLRPLIGLTCIYELKAEQRSYRLSRCSAIPDIIKPMHPTDPRYLCSEGWPLSPICLLL